MNQSAADIRWPAEFDLATRPVHVHNELSMALPRERVWAWLIRATIWPVWYPNSKNVRIVEGPPTDLAYGTRFHWRTFSTAIESQVQEFDPYERIAWDARGLGVYAYHAWLLRETPGGGCHVVTEERQHGWAAKLQDAVWSSRMSNGHQMWLENLHKCAGVG